MASVNLFFLLDLSGSMTANGRLNQLNNAMPDLLVTLREKADEIEANVSVRIIGYNNQADYLYGSVEKGASIDEVVNSWTDLTAGGITRADLAIEESLKSMHNRYLEVENNSDGIIAAPVVILLTDGASHEEERYYKMIDQMKATRKRKKSGLEGILRIAIGVNDCEMKQLEGFASVWPTVVGENDDGTAKIEDKLQVYKVDDAEDLKGIMTQLAISSVMTSIGDDEVVIPIDLTSGDDEKQVSGPIDFSDFE